MKDSAFNRQGIFMKDLLVGRLERRLAEKEQETLAMQASLREEMQKEMQYYHEQLSAFKRQLAEMNASIDGLTRELLDQKMLNVMGGAKSSRKKLSEKRREIIINSDKVKVEVVRKEDDAIVMIRRR